VFAHTHDCNGAKKQGMSSSTNYPGVQLFGSKKRLFTKDCKQILIISLLIFLMDFYGSLVRPMLYGFGDTANPRADTVDAVESCMLQYLGDVLDGAVKVAAKRGTQVAGVTAGSLGNVRLKTEDVLLLLKRDPKKFGRAEELLFMNEELKRVTKAFDENDGWKD
jgi:transcription initiation factor TFIID subunit 13